MGTERTSTRAAALRTAAPAVPSPLPPMALLPLALSLALLAAVPAGSAAPRQAAAIDRARVHADYQAGDFEKVIGSLEAFRESGRRCRKDDSVFLEKHLAVVYAADPATRERGRYHMLRMLDLDPAADLLDMFVGEEVDRIFEKVRKESAMLPDNGARPKVPEPPPGNRQSAGLSAPPAAAPRPAAASRPPAAKVKFRAPGPVPRLESWDLDGKAASRQAGKPEMAAIPKPGPGAVRGVRSLTAPVPDPKPGLAKPSLASKPAVVFAANPYRPGPEVVSPPEEETAEAGPRFRRRWQDPGFWVGGGAVVAVVGLTLYFSGARSENEIRSRTFAVPSQPSE